MEHDLDGILSALREAGTFDSNGEFTLDEARMREKMVRFQLPNPEMWVTTFVAAAVQAGATQMEIDDFGGSWRLRWNGRHLEDELSVSMNVAGFDVLPRLATILRSPTSGGGYLGAMSRAMQALGVLRPTVVTVSSGRVRAEIRDGDVKTSSGPSDRQTRVEINPGDAWSRLRALLDGTSEYAGLAERRALQRTCSLAPLEIKFGQEIITGKFDPGPVLAARFLPGAGPGFSVRLPRSTVTQQRVDAGGVTALLWIPLEPTARRVQSIIVDGVEFAAQDPLPLPDISYIAAVRDLSLDLSLTAVVRDEIYEAAWAVLLEEAQVLYASNEGVGAPPKRRYQWLRDSLPYFQGKQRLSMMARLLSAAMEVDTDVTLTHAAALLEELAPVHPEVASVGLTLRKLLAGRVRHGEDLVAPLVQCVKAEIRLGTPPTVLTWLAVLCALAGDPARARVVLDELRPSRDADAAERCAHETQYALFMRVGGSAKLAREMFEKNLALVSEGELASRNMQYLAETELALGEYAAACEHFEAALRMVSEGPPMDIRRRLLPEDAAVHVALLEGLAEAQERAGHVAEAAHSLEVAIDLGAADAETVSRCARRWSRLHGKGAGLVGMARSLLGIGRAHDDHYRAHVRAPKIPKLAEAEALLPDHAWSALTHCEEALADVVDREGIGGDNYRTVLAMLAYVHRQVDKGNMGDIFTAKIHLSRVFWRQFVAEHSENGK